MVLSAQAGIVRCVPYTRCPQCCSQANQTLVDPPILVVKYSGINDSNLFSGLGYSSVPFNIKTQNILKQTFLNDRDAHRFLVYRRMDRKIEDCCSDELARQGCTGVGGWEVE